MSREDRGFYEMKPYLFQNTCETSSVVYLSIFSILFFIGTMKLSKEQVEMGAIVFRVELVTFV